MVLKFKSKSNSKFMLKGSKTIKIMKRSKNRTGLTQVKTISSPYKQTRNIDILWQQGNHAKKYCFWLCCTLWASYWHTECKINWERTFIEAEPFIEKAVSFWDSSHQRQARNQKFFRAEEVFGKIGHFDKHLVKNLEKKGSQEKVLEFFLLDTPKSTFWMEILTQRLALSGRFSQNQGTSIDL